MPKQHASPLMELVDGFNVIFLKMVELVMLAAPFFVFALLAGVMAKIAGDNPAGVGEVFKGLGVYSFVVVLGLSVLIFIIYPGLMFFFKKTRYYRYTSYNFFSRF